MGLTNNLLLDIYFLFSLFIWLILYGYCEEKFCLSHSGVKGLKYKSHVVSLPQPQQVTNGNYHGKLFNNVGILMNSWLCGPIISYHKKMSQMVKQL